ncbi:MAG: type II toxin-antitoxin system HicB family antitoxin [SAR324 cluster bacterium]|nr:type II toxin-antitoxin system HicB family antitoxin [SAR324 cluster bacterium]
MRIFVVLEKGEEGQEPYGCYSLDAPGCITTGKSVENALENMKEALALYWDGEQLPSSFRSDKDVLQEHPLKSGEFLTSVEINMHNKTSTVAA